MMRRLWLLVGALAVALGTVAAPPAEATTVSCSIPTGPYRVSWPTGCASAKWVKSGSGGAYYGYVHDRDSSWGTVVVEYKTSSGVWRWLASDTYNGSSMTRLVRTVSTESTCRPVRARDQSGTRDLNAC